MRFRFCGDLDVPDWLLAEIAYISKVSARQMHALSEQVVSYILTGDIDYAEVSQLTTDLDGEQGNIKGVVVALHFCLVNSAKYDVGDSTLLLEVQQLGLPKENAEALATCFREAKDSLQARLRDQSYRVNSLVDVAWRVDAVLSSGGSSGKSNKESGSEPTTIGSGSAEAMDAAAGNSNKVVHLKFTVDPLPQRSSGAAVDGIPEKVAPSVPAVTEEVPVAMSADKFAVLFLELKRAKAQMAAIE